MEPAQLPNFETQARRLRYQALGTACRDRGIPQLLVAHHEDDQAENVLLRLAQGHNCMGLQGMQPETGIPECWGIHGVHHGELKYKNPWRNRGFLLGKPSASMPLEAVIPYENRGVTIHRPLLEFSKDRLKATCEHLNVQWVDDKSNGDPTRTRRNAVRSLLQDGKLPRSLQKPSLLALRKRMYLKAEARTVRADSLFERCDINMLDTRIGGLAVRLPSRIRSIRPLPTAYRDECIANAEYKAALMLRQLLYIVSPLQEISLQSLEYAVKLIFPDVENLAAANSDKLAGQFTAGGVLFKRAYSRWDGNPGNGLDQEFRWVLTRQPFHRGKIPTIQIDPAHQHRISESQSIPELNASSPSSTRERHAFQLWDSRHWIWVHNLASIPLRIQPLTPENLRQLRSSLAKTDAESLSELLRAAAPGHVRYTLPVFLQERDGREEVVALPTLGWEHPARKEEVAWKVKYKKVLLPLETLVEPNVL